MSIDHLPDCDIIRCTWNYNRKGVGLFCRDCRRRKEKFNPSKR